MDLDSTFSKVTGSPPTAEDKSRLSRLCGGCDIRGNEAVLALLLVCHFSSAGYAQHPKRVARAIRRAIQTRLPHLERQWAARSATSDGLRRSLALFGTALLGTTALAVLSLALATCESIRLHLPGLLVTAVTTRCGWMMLLALLAPSAWGALWGCSEASCHANDWRRRATGWATLGCVILANSVWGALLLIL